MDKIEIKNLMYEYIQTDNKKKKALDNVNLTINKGEFIAVIGMNGSGKSTLARHLNGLLLPTAGSCIVDGLDTKNETTIWQVRQKVGMVFQNPDNQIIAAIVEDDVAFGPENLGIMPEEIRKRVTESLKAVNMEEKRNFAPHLLSGGQKQLIAIAGVLAMRTDYMVLDEPTAMLDPSGRAAVMEAVHKLHEKYGMTIILITHFMDEAISADRIIVMHDGKVAADGTPREIFSDVEKIRKLGLELPLASQMVHALRKRKIEISTDIYTDDELVKALQL
ncbi:energy-coupling factor transporter ATPase [Pectinatus cerevisiiphilus]|uniref:Energy-coupling factor transport system ATP-binding protein n=1 Tax=Pectinatus cerevisiiphilus TaxID=86956 RepID=A0A4V2US39_9FIRM|nr:energy-coupling factor transporter ATPase [Pectinatus cerevisiiphilus]TCS79972.1 energy-coupling factor transport system ATP-binding protein [Pectinatus cerevisiiphilus]